jgi:hypothetical protein
MNTTLGGVTKVTDALGGEITAESPDDADVQHD